MPESLDIVFRTLAVAAAGLLAGLLLATARRSPAGPPGALFCLAVAAFFVTSTHGSAAVLGAWIYPLTALCVTKAVWFWLFARALFNDGAGLRSGHIVTACVIAIAGTWQQLIFLPQFRAGHAAAFETVVGFGFEAVLLLFVLSGLYEAKRDLTVDLVERRRRLRLGFLLVTGVYLTGTLGVQSFNLLFDRSTPMLATWINMSVVIVGCICAAWFLLQFRSVSWIEPARTVPRVTLSRAEAAILARLEQSLANDRIYLQQGLTVGELARHLGTGGHVLRRVINHGMGHRNFNDFLHEWRIREACDELARPEQARQSILSVAMKVGYGSIGAFNRAFKTRVGMTPTDYRRRTLDGASNAH
ncbi:MAG: AraC family transcriptional regulator [Woeseiaceae bacterium]|nr:AraC family transcriptional regulator [Woeseiaceae bacterium]